MKIDVSIWVAVVAVLGAVAVELIRRNTQFGVARIAADAQVLASQVGAQPERITPERLRPFAMQSLDDRIADLERAQEQQLRQIDSATSRVAHLTLQHSPTDVWGATDLWLLDEEFELSQGLASNSPAVDVRDDHRTTTTIPVSLSLADQFSKTPRNAPCPCDSGKRFKMCHGTPNYATS